MLNGQGITNLANIIQENLQRFTRLNQQGEVGTIVKQARVIAAELFFIDQHLRHFAEHHAAKDIVTLTEFQPTSDAVCIE
ncbi:hypothetical protein D3C78_759960 [compost metagenome]